MIWSLHSKSEKIYEKIFQDRMWPFFTLKSATLHFGCRFAVKSYFWPLLCYDMRTRAIKNVFSVYKFPFPHQALKGLYAVCGPSM